MDEIFEQKALSAREWLQIETVSQSVRTVAGVMQHEAPFLARDRDPDPPQALFFDEILWNAVRGKAEVEKPSKSKKTSGRAETLAKLERQSILDDKLKISVAASCCPRIENFGKRTASFAAALCSWAKSSTSAPALDVAVSCHRACLFLSKRCGEVAADAAIAELRALSQKAVDKAGGIKALLDAIVECPEFLVKPSFTGPQEIEIYPEQRQAARCIARSLCGSPVLLRYITPPSGGKSSAAALFGAVAESVAASAAASASAEERAGSSKIMVIYACFSNAVRVEVSRTVLAASVPFAVVSGGLASPSFRCYHNRESAKRNGHLKLPPPSSIHERVGYSLELLSKCDKRPVVLVCDLESANAFLAQGIGTVLLLDELTVGAEHGREPSKIARHYAEVLRQAPHCTVLMSATVPTFDEMPSLCKLFAMRHEAATFETCSSGRLSIGVDALDSSGRHWLPHQFGCTADEIAADGHLLRFYSPWGLRSLWLESRAPLQTSDLVSHDSIRRAAVRLLRQLSTLSEATESLSDGGAMTSALGLATNKAFKFPGCTLVVSVKGAEGFYNDAMPALMAGVPVIRRLITKTPKLQDHKRKQKKQDSDDDVDERDDCPLPEHQKIKWPMEVLVNSRQHLALHHPVVSGGGDFDKRAFKLEVQLPDDIIECSSERLVESALSGVVLLDSKWSDRAFELAALALSDLAVPTFIVSDLRIVFGTNLPITRVLALLTLNELAQSEVRQLCGRAGRTGKASAAEVVFVDFKLLRAALTAPEVLEVSAAPLDCLLKIGGS
jgi:hypothetical protein